MSTTALPKNSLADLLLSEGWIDQHQYRTALDEYERSRRSLVRIFTDMGAIDEETRLDVLRRTTRYKVMDLRDVTPRSQVAEKVDREFCRRRLAVPLEVQDNHVIVAMDDPTDMRTIGDLEKIFSLSVKPVISTEKDILETIDRLPTDLRTSSAAVQVERSPSVAWLGSISLMVLVFVPIVFFYHFISNTATGEEWYQSLELNTFETMLCFLLVWGSWASVAYFINDLVFGKPNQSS